MAAPPRPWFRLATIARPPAEPQPAPPQPRPAAIGPAFRPPPRQQFQSPPPPPPPELQTFASPPPSGASPTDASPISTTTVVEQVSRTTTLLPPSPPKPNGVNASATTTTTAAAVTITAARLDPPLQSPDFTQQRIEKTPPLSPSIKQVAAPPSPLSLPPPQLKPEEHPTIPLEVEQKTVLVQETTTTEKPKAFYRERENYSYNGKAKGPIQRKSFSDSENMRVITIAGENKGALMEMGYSQAKQGLYVNRRGKIHDGQESRSTGSGNEGRKEDTNQTATEMPVRAYMNSNVQGVNNSLLYNCSCTHHDPGVHLALSRKPGSGRGLLEDRANGNAPNI